MLPAVDASVFLEVNVPTAPTGAVPSVVPAEPIRNWPADRKETKDRPVAAAAAMLPKEDLNPTLTRLWFSG